MIFIDIILLIFINIINTKLHIKYNNYDTYILIINI